MGVPRRRTRIWFLPLAPALVGLVGIATALIVGWLGVVHLRDQNAEAARLRSKVLAEILAVRLNATALEDSATVVERAASRSGAEVLLVDLDGELVADGSLGAPSREERVAHLLAGEGQAATRGGLSQFHAAPLASPRQYLSVITYVHVPEASYRAGFLLTSVGVFTALLVAAASLAALWLARDVHSDVEFVRRRIVEMGNRDTQPVGDAIPVRTIDETGVLTSAFNVLLGRFREAEQAYRRNLAGVVASDRDRSAFLAALSHELRTPLNSILGFADVLLGEAEGPLSADSRENLEVVRSSGQHLRSLIDDILALSALESGQLRLERHHVNVLAIAAEVVREARGTAKGRPLTVELSGEPARAWADPLRVRQILGNVVGNAVKFTRQGQVSVEVGETTDDVEIKVQDTGPGIPPAQQAAIFEEYKQAGDAASRRSGTGLGLAITRRLIHMHGGTIQLQSGVGQGSQFTLRLPKNPPIQRDPSISDFANSLTLQVALQEGPLDSN